ncbi:lanthionine synthetase C family protein [Nonomuraea sp. 3N208]|uniref:lanthionine synthetase C family protein n=1 Tax=Nonomuraea sp. 3N208 TaxID=3457421 RepID=UPI003FD05A1F
MNPSIHDHLAADLAARLAHPDQAPDPDGHPQSLSRGAAGVALLHIERAATGQADWGIAHAWLAAATASPVSIGPQAGLLFGTPALAFVLHGTTTVPGQYERALAALDNHVAALARQRLDQAHTRIDRQAPPSLAEFDLFKGLTGLGAHLLRRQPAGDLLAEVLVYLVRLTRPRSDGLPGWWTHEQPTGRRASATAGGHGNLSMAHGISGPLALLSLASLAGIIVDGQAEAIARICAWTDTWRQHHPAGPWWPEVITLPEARTGRSRQARPLRPSWCYGTPGHVRAQQLAGLALSDPLRQRAAEQALYGCLSDPSQLALVTDLSLCHGWAGLLHTASRIAANANSPALTARVHGLADRLTTPGSGLVRGFLTGSAGLALAATTTVTGWDACLLLNPPASREG